MIQTIDPFPGSYAHWDGFGATAGRKRPHTGIDYPVKGGLPTPALVAGVVTDVRTTAWNGTCVTWQAADGVYVSYLHMSGVAVNTGDVVKLGQTVGYVGDTGTNSLGNHLHVTVSRSSQAYDGIGPLIDPWLYIQSNLVTTSTETETLMEFLAEVKDFGATYLRNPMGFLHVDPDTRDAYMKAGVPVVKLSGKEWENIAHSTNNLIAGSESLSQTAYRDYRAGRK